MSWEAWGDPPDDTDTNTDERVQEAFIDGARAFREMIARFVEQGGDDSTANSIRANWNPAWGDDPGPISGEIPSDAWSVS